MRSRLEGGYEVKRLLMAVTVATLTTSVVGVVPVSAQKEERPAPWTVEWFQNHPKPKASYWDLVAQCETNSNWRDKGQWGGGLGIATTTWRLYGGTQFAAHPSEATRVEQIRVANRIAVRGFIRRDGSFKLPAGYGGWGCIRAKQHLHPHPNNLWYVPKWTKKKG